MRCSDWSERNKALKGGGLLVNTTSLGMIGKPPLELDLAALPKDAVVADIVYNPLETQLLAAARARGNRVVDGLGMLLYQAVPGFERWFGHASRGDARAEKASRSNAWAAMMLVIGLTGSIGMGKSTAAKHFVERGIAVFDADAEVHRLYEAEAVPAIAASFPSVVVAGKVDRNLLARELAASPGRLKELEAIVHPMVVKAEFDFLREQEAKGAKFAVLEIPLLFETGADSRVDVSVVLSAPEEVQRARVLARPGMTAEKLDQLRKAPTSRFREARPGRLRCG